MMVAKRKTPEDDIDRLAERIWRRGRGKIQNQADFISVYNAYLKDSGAKDNKDLQDKVFKKLQQRHKISSSLFTEKKRARVFVQAGMKPSAAEFNILGYSVKKETKQKRRVYARRTEFFVSTPKGRKKRVVYRDVRGRFVKPINTDL